MKYLASCSFGKDSIATILLAIENNEPLDGAVFSEVMFDLARNISGENPEHIEWIYQVAIPELEALGCPVEVVRAERDYVSYFSKIINKGTRARQAIVFPIGGMCAIQRDCKVAPIHKWYKQFTEPIIQYVGIAADEPRRLARLKDNQTSLLDKYGYTEEMAMAKCIEYNLVSPIYESSHRGGCWFCPNSKIKVFAEFRKKHPELWSELQRLSMTPNLCSYGFKYGMTLQEVEARMDAIDRQLTLFELTAVKRSP